MDDRSVAERSILVRFAFPSKALSASAVTSYGISLIWILAGTTTAPDTLLPSATETTPCALSEASLVTVYVSPPSCTVEPTASASAPRARHTLSISSSEISDSSMVLSARSDSSVEVSFLDCIGVSGTSCISCAWIVSFPEVCSWSVSFSVVSTVSEISPVSETSPVSSVLPGISAAYAVYGSIVITITAASRPTSHRFTFICFTLSC